MRLDELLGGPAARPRGQPDPDAGDVEITGLAYDSRAVGPGSLFFCVSGFRADGHDFAPDAVARRRRQRSWSSARWAWACPRSWSSRRARRWRRWRPASTAIPTAS